MSTTSVDGLVSGLQTTDLINKLLDVERAPQKLLQQQQTALQKAISAFQSLNTKFSGIATAVQPLVGDSLTPAVAWQSMTATSSDASRVSVSAQPNATPGTLSFSVTNLATAGTSFSSGTTASASDVVTSATSLVLTKGGTSTTISLTTGTLTDVANAVNKANAGVTAAVVQTGAGAYKLQLTSTTTGANTSVSLTDSGGADPFAASTLGPLTVNAGSDAQLYVGAPGAGYTVTRSSNTISDLMPGATFTLLKADPAVTNTVSVSADSSAVADQVGKMVDAVNAALGQITLDSAYNATTKVGGAFTGDPLARSLQQSLVNAVTGAVAGTTLGSPGLAGVSVTRDGAVSFDRAKFLAAYAKDPAGVQSLLGAGTPTAPGVAGRLAAVAKNATDSGTGQVFLAVSNRQNRVDALGKQIDDWDTRLSIRETTLRAQFTAMETALGNMKSQSNWLAGQISSLS